VKIVCECERIRLEEKRKMNGQLNNGERVSVRDALLSECEQVSFKGGGKECESVVSERKGKHILDFNF